MRNIPIMIFISVLFLIFLLDGEIGLSDGLVFTLGLIIYLIVNVILARKEKNTEVDAEFKEGLSGKFGIPLSIVFIIVGL